MMMIFLILLLKVFEKVREYASENYMSRSKTKTQRRYHIKYVTQTQHSHHIIYITKDNFRLTYVEL